MENKNIAKRIKEAYWFDEHVKNMEYAKVLILAAEKEQFNEQKYKSSVLKTLCSTIQELDEELLNDIYEAVYENKSEKSNNTAEEGNENNFKFFDCVKKGSKYNLMKGVFGIKGFNERLKKEIKAVHGERYDEGKFQMSVIMSFITTLYQIKPELVSVLYKDIFENLFENDTKEDK